MARRASKYGKGFYANYSVGGRPLAKPYQKRGRLPRLISVGSHSRRFRSPSLPMTKGNIIAVSVIAVLMVLGPILLVLGTVHSVEEENNRLAARPSLTFEDVISESHPRLYDNEDGVKDYYDAFSKTIVTYPSSHPDVEGLSVCAMSNGIDSDHILSFRIDFRNIDGVPDSLELADIIDIAVDYIPINVVLDCYNFEKAIYKELSDGSISYECYYVEKEGHSSPYYYEYNGESIKMSHGFSLVIVEHSGGGYTIEIDTDWYDNKYDTDPIGRIGVTEEELATHNTWNYQLG